ncbi:MAG: hypothetical protein ACTSPS_10865 [Promethearchaeota archaeon]
MIGKLLLISEGGLLPFYLNQDEIDIDNVLLSGFCSAIYNFSKELTFPLRSIQFQGHQMIMENFMHENGENFLMAALFDEYHIGEGIKTKLKFIFDKYFKTFELEQEGLCITDDNLNKEIKDILNDNPLKNYLNQNMKAIMALIEPVLRENHEIYAYSLNSSSNNILYCNGSLEIFKNRTENTLEEIIKDYLLVWKLEKVPQGDQFTGQELPTGLDLNDYVNTDRKMYGIVVNTSFNLKEESNNELLLYLFGKSTLMRSFIPHIEVKLREILS